ITREPPTRQRAQAACARRHHMPALRPSHRPSQRLALRPVALAVTFLAAPVWAQTTPAPAPAPSTSLETVTVTGIPASLESALTVRKSSSPHVDEGSLCATIDLRTARPFDLRGFQAAVSLKSTYNDLSGKATPKASFLISNAFADKKIGALLSGAYSKRKVY